DYQAFVTRELSAVAVEYLFCDAVFESLRRQGAKEALVVAWCIDSEGRKHLPHLAVAVASRRCAGPSSSAPWWPEACAHRPRSDGAPGVVPAIDSVFGALGAHPLLVPPAREHPRQAPRRRRRRGPRPPLCGA